MRMPWPLCAGSYHAPVKPGVIGTFVVAALVTLIVPVMPIEPCTSQWKPIVPAAVSVIVELQLLPLGLPLPPLPSQPFAQRNEPSSAATLCVPPLLTNVTVSPTFALIMRGLKLRCG